MVRMAPRQLPDFGTFEKDYAAVLPVGLLIEGYRRINHVPRDLTRRIAGGRVEMQEAGTGKDNLGPTRRVSRGAAPIGGLRIEPGVPGMNDARIPTVTVLSKGSTSGS